MRKMGLSAAAAVVAVGMLTACAGADTEEGAGKDTAAAASSPAAGADEASASKAALKDARIIRSGFRDHETWGPGAYVVEYKITNGGAEAADYFVGLEFIDKDDDVLGSTGVTADKLGPGKSSAGDTAPLEAEIRNGTLSDIVSVRVSEVDRNAS